MESQDFQNIATSVRPKLMNLCRSFFDKQELAYDADIDVYNPDDEVAKSYGEKGKNGVMKIYTKKQDDAIVYIVDGKIASKEDFNILVPESIKEIKVLKRGTAAAMKASTEGGYTRCLFGNYKMTNHKYFLDKGRCQCLSVTHSLYV